MGAGGLASQKLGLVTDAITAFESYLAWGEGDRAEEVTGRLAALRDLVDRDAAFAQEPALTPTPAAVAAAHETAAPLGPPPIHRVPERSETSSRKWWPWALAGGVVAAAVAVAIAVPLVRKGDSAAERVEPNTGLSIDALWRSR